MTSRLIATALLVLTLQAVTGGDPQAEFYFARLEYPGFYDNTYIKNWYTDYPEMDQRVSVLFNRLTGIRAASVKVQIDRNIFRYPFIYIVEPEQVNIDDGRTDLLREYLDRGGFLMLDDFHGEDEKLAVENLMARILPGRDDLTELDTSHEIFHVFYDIDEIIQVVNDGLVVCVECDQWENGPTGRVPQIFAHYDDYGNMNMLLLYNNDAWDALEWLDDPNYPRHMASFAARLFMNVGVYVMTH